MVRALAKNAPTKTSTRSISWWQYDKDVKILASKIKRHCLETKFKFDEIYGIKRGGLVMAVHLSHLLDVPYTQCLTSGKKLLICDDLVDSGDEMRKLQPCKDWVTATLYRKSHTTYEPNFTVRTINAWVVFPWEVKSPARR